MIILDYRDKRPIYEQVVDKLERLIVGGALEADTKMPSVRSLAVELSVNPNTIQRAYVMLEQMGYLYTISGRGNFVAPESEWRGSKVQEMLKECHEMLLRAKESGVTKEQLLAQLSKVFEEAEHD
ncbi:MAG: GntR family transcriptional regulator [Lachnospiraceae bacterium]|nr:GntR family transcriptional regulator [Lachnospiraceae bacterium]